MRQICQALEAAHRQGIVHRDLKPDNIWIVQPQHGDSYAKLLDFGIAKLMGDADEGHRTQTGIVMGTPAYMSPEQCRGVNVEKGTDIYALGMILYEMFAGQLPFQGSFAELITHHLMTVPDPPSRHGPLPRALEQLILRCIDKDPAQRPQSAEALGKALDASLPTADEHVQTAAVVPMAAAPVAAAAAPAPGAPPPTPSDTSKDTLAPPPGRTASDLTIQPARSRRPLLWVGAAAAGALVAVAVALGGRHGGGEKGALVTVVDAQPPPATTTANKPMPGRAHVVVRGADDARVLRVLRVLIDGRSWRRGSARRAFWTSRPANRTPCASKRWIARPTSGHSRSPPAPRPSWKSPWRPPHRRRSNRTRRPRTRSATTRPRPRPVSPPRPRRRPPRQKHDTGTVWSVTTSSTVSSTRT